MSYNLYFSQFHVTDSLRSTILRVNKHSPSYYLLYDYKISTCLIQNNILRPVLVCSIHQTNYLAQEGLQWNSTLMVARVEM